MNTFRPGWTTTGLVSIAIFTATGGIASADVIKVVTPAVARNAEGNGFATPSANPIRIQHLVLASDFANLPASQRLLVAFNFRANNSQTQSIDWGSGEERIWMSTTTSNALTTVFAQNHGSNKTLVHDGPIRYPLLGTGPAGGPRDIGDGRRLDTPFFYDPSQGNLLVERLVFSTNPSPRATIDALQSGSLTLLNTTDPLNATSGMLSTPAVLQFEFDLRSVSAWSTDADGNWSEAANWDNGTVRNAADSHAILGGIITQPRTVNLDAPITVGRIEFENTNSYTVAGNNSITLDVSSGVANINVNTGSHTISAPVILADNGLISVSPAASNLSITGGLNAANVSLVKAGAGTLTVNQLRAAGLTINGGKIVLAAGSSAPAVIAAPTIPGGLAPTATLDLTDNAAVLDYSGTNTVARARAQLLAGRKGMGLGGSWTGMGITSSTAAAANATAPDSRSLGFADNATLPLGPYTSFHGEPADNTTVLVAYTRTGDANLDGVVNDDDVTIIGATYAPGVPQPSWALGDFDYNGFVDDDDVTLLGAFYDPSAPPLNSQAAPGAGEGVASGVSAVPEPSTGVLALFVLVLAAAVKARGRHCRGLGPLTPASHPGTEGIVPGPARSSGSN